MKPGDKVWIIVYGKPKAAEVVRKTYRGWKLYYAVRGCISAVYRKRGEIFQTKARTLWTIYGEKVKAEIFAYREAQKAKMAWRKQCSKEAGWSE